MKIGYLGPEGTFSEQAATEYSSVFENSYMIKFPTIYKVIQAVANDEVDYAVVPFENSIEGTVTTTLDSLIFDFDLYIKTEIVINIEQNLLIKKGCNVKNINKIISHQQGISQCEKFIRKYYPNAIIETVSSTSEAARVVSISDGDVASISPSRSADVYNLDIAYNSIQDDNKNATRFLVITKEDTRFKSIDKTSIVFSTENKPGELYKILDIISIWDLNMTKIESRPKKHELGTYCFFADLESNNLNDLQDALKMVERKTIFYKNLGSYSTFNK